MSERVAALSGRVAPYNEWGSVSGLIYERLAPGCFTASLARKGEVPLRALHRRRAPIVGMVTDWWDRPDGLYARFAIADDPVAQAAALASRDGALPAFSVGVVTTASGSDWESVPVFDPYADPPRLDKVTRRRVTLEEVSLVPAGVFASALVAEWESEGERASVHDLVAWRRALDLRHDAEPADPPRQVGWSVPRWRAWLREQQHAAG
jgi:HK97 family phage prohead protease